MKPYRAIAEYYDHENEHHAVLKQDVPFFLGQMPARPRRQSVLFPRELRILLERNGLAIEHLWGNYDGSPLGANSPRMIARCCRM